MRIRVHLTSEVKIGRMARPDYVEPVSYVTDMDSSRRVPIIYLELSDEDLEEWNQTGDAWRRVIEDRISRMEGLRITEGDESELSMDFNY